ncbi:hypothetical protein QTP70_021677, partial [Hemibagrus guttatus]
FVMLLVLFSFTYGIVGDVMIPYTMGDAARGGDRIRKFQKVFNHPRCLGIVWPSGASAASSNLKMRRSSTDETPYRRSPSLDSKTGSPPFCFGSDRERRGGAPFGFSFRTAPGTKTAKAGYATAQGRKYVVFYLDLSFIFLLELRRCRMAEGCMRALRYAMVFFNLLFWIALTLK